MSDLDDGHRLTKVTVNLTPRAVDAMESVCGRARESKTEAINRALPLLLVLDELLHRSDGRGLLVVQPDGSVERIYLL
ncbi:hypothetical protein [Micromonospora sp. NPDC004704]